MPLTLRENVPSAIVLLERVQKANPDDPLLTNNLTFALAITGEVNRAIAEFSKISRFEKSEINSYVYNATGGLLEFRIGNTENGRRRYSQSIEYFEKNKKNDHALHCKSQLAFEELRLGFIDEAEKIISELSDLEAQKKKQEFKSLTSKLIDTLENSD